MKKTLLFISALVAGMASFAQCTCNPAVGLDTIGVRSDNGQSGISHDGVLRLTNAQAGGAYTHTFTVAVKDPTVATINSTYGPATVTLSPLDSVTYTPISLPTGLSYTGKNTYDTVHGNSIYCFKISGNLPATHDTVYKWYVRETPHGILSSVILGTTYTATVPTGTLTGCPICPLAIDLTNKVVDSIMITVSHVTTPTITAVVTASGDTLTSSTQTIADTANQWYLNGVAIQGATGTKYVVKQNGDYTVIGKIVSKGATSAISNTITISNFPSKPTITTTGDVLTSSAPTGNQWYKNGSLIAGATSTTYTATENGKYTVVVTITGLSSQPSDATTVGDILSCTPNTSVILATQGIKSDDGKSGISGDGKLTVANSGAAITYDHTFTVAIQDPTLATVPSPLGGTTTITITPVDSVIWTPITLPSGLTYTGGTVTNLSYGKTIYCFRISGTLPSTAGVQKWYIKQTPHGMLNTSAGTTTAPTGTLNIAGIGAYPIDISNTTVDSIMIDITTGIQTLEANQFGVLQNVPNPFSGTTSISFSVPNSGTIQFTVVDLLGRVVNSQTINANAGVNTITYAAGTDSGTYFYSISDGVHSVTKKLVVSK